MIAATHEPVAGDIDRRTNLTLKEAAAWYGVCEKTLRRRIAEGALPAVRVGPRSIRVSAADVAALATPVPADDASLVAAT